MQHFKVLLHKTEQVHCQLKLFCRTHQVIILNSVLLESILMSKTELIFGASISTSSCRKHLSQYICSFRNTSSWANTDQKENEFFLLEKLKKKRYLYQYALGLTQV